MRVANENLLQLDGAVVSGDLSTSRQFKPVYLGHIFSFSVQCVVTGTPNGTFKLQASNDPVNALQSTEAQQASQVVNWTDIQGSEAQVTEAGNVLWDAQNSAYEWVRLVWVADSAGTSPVLTSARIKVKGV